MENVQRATCRRDRECVREHHQFRIIRLVAALSVTAFFAYLLLRAIETCRAKVAKLFKPTEITYRALFEYYGDESDDLELWQCCRLTYQLLRQTHTALIPLGAAPYQSWPRERGKIATGCEAQQRWLGPVIHVIRAVIYVLVDRKPVHLGEMLPALRHLERGINDVIGALEQVIQRCRPRAGRRGAR